MVAVIKTPEVASLLGAGGFEVMGSKPEEFDRYLADQLQRWAAIVKKTGITSE
jgi:tripartite-type tricarboxylate transporter receptor subunit TctC